MSMRCVFCRFEHGVCPAVHIHAPPSSCAILQPAPHLLGFCASGPQPGLPARCALRHYHSPAIALKLGCMKTYRSRVWGLCEAEGGGLTQRCTSCGMLCAYWTLLMHPLIATCFLQACPHLPLRPTCSTTLTVTGLLSLCLWISVCCWYYCIDQGWYCRLKMPISAFSALRMA